MMMIRGAFPLLLLSLSLLAGPALADDPEKIGSFKDWEAYSYKADDSKVCFAFATPKKSEASRKADRGEIRFIVTNYPGRKVKGQISTVLGFTAKDGSGAALSIDDKAFTLYPKGDTAWAGTDDAEIISAMKSGKGMVLKATSKKGTETTDTYSLAGISAALDAIDKACK
ncbi:MAG: invasion associated locus B family protein [Hyphomicrobiales bacterium]